MYNITYIIHDKESNTYILREEYVTDNYIDKEIRKLCKEENISYFLAFKKVVYDYINDGIITKCIVTIDTLNTSIEIDTSTIEEWNSFFIYKTYSSDGGSDVNTVPTYIGVMYDNKSIELDIYNGSIVRMEGFSDK